MEGSSSDQPSDGMVDPFLSDQEQRHLNDSILRIFTGLFPRVTKIAHHEKILLLTIVVQAEEAGDHLNPDYAKFTAALSLSVQHPEVLSEVERAWESKTFKDLIRLGILLIDPLTPVLIQPLQKFLKIRSEPVFVPTTLISRNHKVSLLGEIWHSWLMPAFPRNRYLITYPISPGSLPVLSDSRRLECPFLGLAGQNHA